MPLKKKKDYEVGTTLTESQYKAMLQVIEAEGLTQAGFIRHLILHHIVEKHDEVSRLNGILNSTKTGVN